MIPWYAICVYWIKRSAKDYQKKSSNLPKTGNCVQRQILSIDIAANNNL